MDEDCVPSAVELLRGGKAQALGRSRDEEGPSHVARAQKTRGSMMLLLLSLPRASSLPRLPETCARASVFVSHRTLPSVAVQSVRNGPIREETPSSSTQIDSTAAFDPTRTPSALALVILLMTAGAATAAVDGTAAADVSATATAALPIDNLSTLLAALPIEVVDGATDGDPPGDSLSGLFGPALATLFLGSGLVPSLKLANSQESLCHADGPIGQPSPDCPRSSSPPRRPSRASRLRQRCSPKRPPPARSAAPCWVSPASWAVCIGDGRARHSLSLGIAAPGTPLVA